MNISLKDYLEIYQKFPLDGYYSKEQRKIRYKMITSWENTDLQELPSLDELMNFVRQYQNIIQITPQFFEKYKSVWQDNMNKSYQFAEFLLEMDLDELIHKFDISSMHLATQVLNHNPNHTKALKLKLKVLVRYHDFCLHELPWGVLVEKNLEEELKSVEEMQEIAKKLDIKNESFEVLVSYCKKYYPLWFEYLKLEEKTGFKSFLISKGIDTERIFLSYVVI